MSVELQVRVSLGVCTVINNVIVYVSSFDAPKALLDITYLRARQEVVIITL